MTEAARSGRGGQAAAQQAEQAAQAARDAEDAKDPIKVVIKQHRLAVGMTVAEAQESLGPGRLVGERAPDVQIYIWPIWGKAVLGPDGLVSGQEGGPYGYSVQVEDGRISAYYEY
jgi:hypothetical protein